MTKLYWFIFKKRKKILDLVYTINPLPHSLLNFVFDFGNLSNQDEKRYIESMVTNTIKNIYKNINKKDYEMIQNFAFEVIIESKNFIRNNEEISSYFL